MRETGDTHGIARVLLEQVGATAGAQAGACCDNDEWDGGVQCGGGSVLGGGGDGAVRAKPRRGDERCRRDAGGGEPGGEGDV